MNRLSELPLGIAGFLAILVTWSLWAKGDLLNAMASTVCIILFILAQWIDHRQRTSIHRAAEAFREIADSISIDPDRHDVTLRDAARNPGWFGRQDIARIAETEGDLELSHLARFGGLTVEQLRNELQRRYGR